MRISPCFLFCIVQDSCGRVLDKYCEYDLIVVFIDLVLLKSSAYRHMLLNTPKLTHVWRLALIMFLLDVYVRWFRIEKVSIAIF